jgi:hypothetical protein
MILAEEVEVGSEVVCPSVLHLEANSGCNAGEKHPR